MKSSGGTCGGVSPRCTGLATAADPGSGTNQACACKYGEYVLGYWGDQSSSAGGQVGIMSGGDSLIYLDDVPTGYASDLATCSTSYPYGCATRPPPSGTANNPTEIYGVNHASCDSKSDYTKIWGRERVPWIFNLAGHDYIEFKCLNLTDKSNCIASLNGQAGNSIVCNRDTYPMGNHADNGIYDFVGGASHILLDHVWIHGLVRGVFANKKDNWTLNDSESSFNSSTNWDNDMEGDGAGTSNADTGTITFNRWVNSWGGCGEDWQNPGTAYYCASQGQSAYGDCQTTGGGNNANYIFNGVTMEHCVSDAIDNLYDDGTSTTMEVIKGKFQGNSGQAIKSAAKLTYIENTIAIGNCGSFQNKSYTAYDPAQSGRSGTGCNNNTICEATENSVNCRWVDDNDNGAIDAGEGDCAPFDHCRAGSILSFANKTGGQKWYNKNSTFYSNGDTIMTMDGENTCDIGTIYDSRNSYFISGIEFNDGSDKSDFFYSDGSGTCTDCNDYSGDCTGKFVPSGDYNYIINSKNGSSDVFFQAHSTWSTSVSRLVGTVPLNTSYLTADDVFDNFKLTAATNDARTSVDCQADCSIDVNSFGRGSTWDIGAFEYGSTATSSCGDGVIDIGEQCDGAALNGQSCTSNGYDEGYLGCTSGCVYDFSGCSDFCGNGTIETGEECDGSNLNGSSCISEGFDSGNLACNGCVFDTNGCFDDPCGNNNIDGSEQCDGTNLNSQTCQTLGFTYGTLACHVDCTRDTSGCSNPSCGNGIVEAGEQCDGAALNSKTCVTQGFDSGSLSCNGSCLFNTSSCAYNCGNGTIQSPEACDGSNLNSKTCITQGFDGGTLACNSACTFNTSACTTVTCGNNVIEGSEPCDGTALNSQTCTTQGFDSGTLSCTNCAFNTSACAYTANTGSKMIIGGKISAGGIQNVQ